MPETGLSLFAVGIAIAGIGINLAFKSVTMKKHWGGINWRAWAYGFSIFFMIMGIITMGFGIIAM
jgi:hypothetical protein